MHSVPARSLLGALLIATSAAGQREESLLRSELDLTPLLATGVAPCTNIIPVLACNRVLVTSTLRLFAFDACSGERLWTAEPPAGWAELEPAARNELFDGLDREHLWVAPAAGERVAVAALQIPLSRCRTEKWSGLPIRTALPERRLFAFDLASGRALWSHAPAPGHDPFTGPYAQRMNVIGSPLVVGALVLVPCTRDESSIDYQVACYALESGELLWKTFVLRGQVERNQLGMQCIEFAAAPLVCAPSRGCVLAQTGLGCLVALDLAGGGILWRSDYERVPLPRSSNGGPRIGPKSLAPWHTAPPLLLGDLVLAAPPDSSALLAFDLVDGRGLWSVARSSLQELVPCFVHPHFDHLIGAVADTIYLGGEQACALKKRGGLASTDSFELAWAFPPSEGTTDTAGEALDGDDLLLPLHDARTPGRWPVLARSSGAIRTWLNAPDGICLLAPEALFVLTDQALVRCERR